MKNNNIEKRLYPRINYPCTVHISINRNIPVSTHTENICKGGACVIFTKSLKIYSELEIEIELPGENSNIKCPAVVMWTFKNMRSSQYNVGLNFLNTNPADRERVGRFVDSIFFKQNKN